MKGRQADSQRRRTRVLAAISALTRSGERLSVASVAHAAGVDRAFLYRHPDLLARIRSTEPDLPEPCRDRPELCGCGCGCHAAHLAEVALLREEVARLNRLLADRA